MGGAVVKADSLRRGLEPGDRRGKRNVLRPEGEWTKDDDGVIASARKAALSPELYLDLSQRGLTEIPALVRVSPLLRSVNLSRNAFTEVPMRELLDLEALIKLDISHNRITGIPTPPPRVGRLGVLWRLTSLDCSHNLLAMQPELIRNLPALTFLDISSNPLEALDASAIYDATSLVGLGVGGGSISLEKEDIAASVAALTSLKRLELAGVGLGEEPWVTGMEMLAGGERVDDDCPSCACARAAFEEEEDPDGAPEEETEEARKERETREEEERQRVETQERLEREREEQKQKQGESASKILELLWTKVDLTHLDLRGNKLRHLPAVLDGLPNLQHLNLSENLLLRVPEGVLNVTTLTSLSVSTNLIVDWPPGLTRLCALEELDLSWNQIARLPPYGVDSDGEWTYGTLPALSTVTHLDLSSNTLRDVRPALLMPNLSHLILKGNPIVKPSSEEHSPARKDWLDDMRRVYLPRIEEEKEVAEREKIEREEAEAVRREAENIRRIAEAMKDFHSMMEEEDFDD